MNDRRHPTLGPTTAHRTQSLVALIHDAMRLRLDLAARPAPASMIELLQPDPVRTVLEARLREQLALIGGHVIDALQTDQRREVIAALDALLPTPNHDKAWADGVDWAPDDVDPPDDDAYGAFFDNGYPAEEYDDAFDAPVCAMDGEDEPDLTSPGGSDPTSPEEPDLTSPGEHDLTSHDPSDLSSLGEPDVASHDDTDLASPAEGTPAPRRAWFASVTPPAAVPAVSAAPMTTTTAAAPAPSVASEAMVALFASQFGQARPSLDESSSPHDKALRAASQDQQILADALRDLGPTPRKLKGNRKVREKERDALLRTVRDRLDAWATCSADVDHELTSWVTARLRAVQQAEKVRPEDTSAVEYTQAFGSLAHHAQTTRHGRVHGLMRTHEPEHGTWLADAQHHEKKVRALRGSDPSGRSNADDEIRRLTEAVREGALRPEDFLATIGRIHALGVAADDKRLVNLVRACPDVPHEELPKALRRAVEKQLQDESDDDQVSTPELPSAWPGFVHTRGKRAALIGGDPRTHRIDTLKNVFEFAELDWIDAQNGGPRALDRLVERMRSASVDVVIALRAFSSHMITDRVFRARHPGVLVVLADTYGANQVRLGVERFTGLRRASDDLTGD